MLVLQMGLSALELTRLSKAQTESLDSAAVSRQTNQQTKQGATGGDEFCQESDVEKVNVPQRG